MTDTATASKSCPACFQTIDARALRCAHCAQRQTDVVTFHREVPGRVVAGVCAALATHFNWDLTLMRIAFVASFAVFGPLSAWVYLAAWLMTPFAANGKTPLVRLFDWLANLFSPRPSSIERV